MDFRDTGLPNTPLFQETLKSGWEKCQSGGADGYMNGPVAMAKMIAEHGGECRHVAAATALAARAVFTEDPSDALAEKVRSLAVEILTCNFNDRRVVTDIVPQLSADAKIFLQASAIMLLEQIVHEENKTPDVRRQMQRAATEIYSAARGEVDTYKLDTRFEIAAMKAAIALGDQAHTWGAVKPVPAMASRI